VLEGHNISKNNVIETDVEVIFPGDTANFQLSKTYSITAPGTRWRKLHPVFSRIPFSINTSE
jgi:hypothetical protein